MADLTSKTPSTTYKSILNVGTADNQELDTTLRIVEDGKGNDSDLKLATNQVRVNTKLGIGDDPDYTLHILSAQTQTTLIRNNTDTMLVGLRDQDTTSDSHVGFGVQDNDFLIRAGNAEKFRIKSDGKVGIGTTTPNVNLQVDGSDNTQIQIRSSDGTKVPILALNNTDMNWHLRCDGGNGDKFIIRDNTNSANRLAIDTTGKVGIGTISPTDLLEIQGAESETYQYPLVLRNPYNHETNLDYGVGIKFRFDDNSSVKWGAIAYEANSAWGNSGDLKFYVDGNTYSSPVMTMQNGGNVGIGTTSPNAPLHVKTTADGSCLKLESTESGSAAAPNINLHRNSSSPADDDVLGKIVFRGEDDAGASIGYAAIYGQMMDVSENETDGKIRMYIRKDGQDKGAMDLNSSSAIFNYSAADIDFRVMSANNSYCLHLNAANDNVGIGGTPNASYTFDVQRTTAGYAQRILNNSTASASHGLLISAGKDEEHASHPLFIENQAGDDLFKITARGTMTLGGATNNSEYSLLLKARSGVDSRILLDGSGNSAMSMLSFQNKYGNRFSNIKGADEGSSNSGISFATGNGGSPSERMRIDKDGKVGIGTTNPTADLHINNSSAEPTILLTGPGSNPADAARIRFSEQSDGNNYIELKYDGNSNILSFDSNDQADMLSVDRTNNRIFTGTSTKLGVGTSSPQTTLDVRGSVSVGQGSEVTIASGVITVTDSYHKVDTEGDASSDNLDTINGGQIGQMLFLRQVDSGRDVVLTESGNILLPGSTFTLSNAADLCLLLYTGANWQMVSTSDNA